MGTMRNVRKARYLFAAGAAASVLPIAAACGTDDSADTAATATTSAPASSVVATPSSATGAAVAPTGTYTDGTYEASGSDTNPGGQSSVSVSMTLASGTVTAVTVTPEASGTSREYQDKFAGGIAAEIVGKNIDDLNVSKVSGSSLTSGGFNAALEQIKAEAKA